MDDKTIYQQLTAPNDDLIELLMGEGGEAYLDQEILKVRDEIGEE